MFNILTMIRDITSAAVGNGEGTSNKKGDQSFAALPECINASACNDYERPSTGLELQIDDMASLLCVAP